VWKLKSSSDSCASLLASWENVVSAGSSNEGDDGGASCVCECIAVSAVGSGSRASSCALLSGLVSAVLVCNGVRSALVEGLSVAIAGLWLVSWLKSLSSGSALILDDLSAPSSNKGWDGGALVNCPLCAVEKSSAGHLMEHSVTTWVLQACAVTE